MKPKRPHKRYRRVCCGCSVDFIGKYEQRYCTMSCAMRARWARGECSIPRFETREDRKRLSRLVGESVRRKLRKSRGGHGYRIRSIYEMSSRTRRKVLSRLGLPCSRCGWNEAICDIHHIRGRKIRDADNHRNLSYICPNCHRLVGERKVLANELVPLTKTFPRDWRKHYYGA